jgi:hypothetical protein
MKVWASESLNLRKFEKAAPLGGFLFCTFLNVKLKG